MGMPANPQQVTVNKIMPVMITGMFLFFPKSAGVLLYMVIANIFSAQLLTREALPDNLQPFLMSSARPRHPAATAGGAIGNRLPFEPKGGNK